MGFSSVKSMELVWPATYILPAASSAMALASSAPVPPQKVEKFKALPVAFRTETKASYRPLKDACSGTAVGKSGDEVKPATYALPFAATANPLAQSKTDPPRYVL